MTAWTPVCLSVWTPLGLLVSTVFCLSVCLDICLYTCLFICLSISLYTSLTVCLFVCVLVYLSVQLYIIPVLYRALMVLVFRASLNTITVLSCPCSDVGRPHSLSCVPGEIRASLDSPPHTDVRDGGGSAIWDGGGVVVRWPAEPIQHDVNTWEERQTRMCAIVCFHQFISSFLHFYQFISFNLYTRLSVSLDARLSLSLDTCLCVSLDTCLSVCLDTCLSVSQSRHLSVYLCVFLYRQMSNICLSLCLHVWTHLSVRQSVCVPV